MSVLIRGMEMPTRCGRCDMCITEADGDIDFHKACCITGAVIENLGEKMEDCPLFPVQPHGRLIDADAPDADLERQDMHTGKWDAVGFSIEEIENALTIIPAEEEK